jgi:phosphoglycolate phosphatase-like HAD superfamily hydrolase
MHVVLFDIDGTLVLKRSTEANERERFRRAVSDVVGRFPPAEPWRYDGMVDPEICRLLLIEVGLSPDSAAEHLQAVVGRVAEIYLTMDKRPVLNDGVEELLRILSASSNHELGVLTGNLSAVAEEKLRLTGIRAYFAETFYSDGYFDRGALVRDAVDACVRKYRLRGNRAVTIVGDTPRDMEAANANGARAIGVASGFYSAGELTRAGAVAVFQSLDPSNALLAALGVEVDERPQ